MFNKKFGNIFAVILFSAIIIYAIIGNDRLSNIINNLSLNNKNSQYAFIALSLFIIFSGITILLWTIRRYKDGFFYDPELPGIFTITKKGESIPFYFLFVFNLIGVTFLLFLGSFFLLKIFI